jgi:hypothetical protein
MMFKLLPKDVKLHLLSFFADSDLSAFSCTDKSNHQLVNEIYQKKINRMFNINSAECEFAEKIYYQLHKELKNIIHYMTSIRCFYDVIDETSINSLDYQQQYDLYYKQVNEILMADKYHALCESIDEENIPTQSEEEYQNEIIISDKTDLLVHLFRQCIHVNAKLFFNFLLKKDEFILEVFYQKHPLKSHLLQEAINSNSLFWVNFFLEKKAITNVEEDSFLFKPLSYAIDNLIHHSPKNLSVTKEIIQLLLKAKADPYEKSFLTNQQTLIDYCQQHLNNSNNKVKDILNLIINYSPEPVIKKRKMY